MEVRSFLDQAIAYIPQEWRYAIAANEILPKRAEGTVLFADISGFTPLSEALVDAFGPRRGAEEMPRYLNEIYTRLIAEIDRYSGSVIDFAGDSITCWFDDQGFSQMGSARACAAALNMQAAMQAFDQVLLPNGARVAVRVKIAAASGPVRRFLVGDMKIQRIAVLAGETLLRVADGEHLSAPGEIWLDDRTVTSLPGRIILGSEKVTARGDLFRKCEGLSQPVPACPWPELPPGSLSEEQVAPWLLRPVYERLRDHLGEFLTELRPSAALFLRFSGLDFDADPRAGRKLDDLVCKIQQVVASYEGNLLQITIGDKGSYVYASFGAIVAHEDDARRAVDAALMLREQCAALDGPGELQIGISQGIMRTGTCGSPNRRTYAVLGEDANLAARLMSRAVPGEILVSNHVYQSVIAERGLHYENLMFEARVPVAMKGKIEPVPVFAVNGIQQRRSIRLHEPAYALPMVGRQQELRLIEEKIELALSGKGQVVGITGDAGIGKSRMVAEVIRSAHRKGLDIFAGACQSDATNTSYLVWGPIWRAIFDVNPDAPVKRQVRSLENMVQDYAPGRVDSIPLLGSLLAIDIPDNDFTAELEPQYRRMALEALLVDCLKSAAREAKDRHNGLVLVFEDLHWIDPISLDLLERAARATTDLPVLYLLAYRPLEVQFQPALRIEKLAQFTKVSLAELPDQEAEQALRAKFAQLYPEWHGAMPRPVIRLVIEHAQGNPFYAEELLNYLNDRNVDFHNARAVEAMELPTSLYSLILSRIDRLTALEQITLKSASVIGRIFQPRVVNRMMQQSSPEAAMNSMYAELLHRELIRRTEKGGEESQSEQDDLEYIFKHIITQEVAYNSLLASQRQLLHRIAAEAIEGLFPDGLDDLSGTLAYHYERGEVTEKAIHYLVRASRQASSIFANAEAISYCQKAIPIVERQKEADPDGPWKAIALDLNERLGDFLEQSGMHEDSRQAYEKALALTGADDRTGKARIVRKTGRTWEVQSKFEQVIAAYDRAEAILGEARDDPGWRSEWIEMMNARLYLYYWMARTEEMKAVIQRLEPVIELSGTPRQKQFFLQNVVSLNFRLERYLLSKDTVQVAEQLLQVSIQQGDLPGLAQANFYLGFAYLWSSSWEKSVTPLLAGLALSEKVGDVVTMLRSLTYATTFYRRKGEVEVVEGFIPRCLEAAAQAKMIEYAGTAYGNQAWARWKRGDLDGFDLSLKAAIEAWDMVSKTHASRAFQWVALLPALSVALNRGDLTQAVDYAQILVDPYHKRLEADLAQALTDAAGAAGDGQAERALELLHRAVQLAKEYAYL